MKKKLTFGLILGLVSAVALSGSPAQAGTPSYPEIVDPAGDANFVNGQGNGVVTLHDAPDARPASMGQSDIRAVWLETAYETVTETEATGQTTRTRHTPTGLRVHFRTEEPPIPSFGPSMVFGLPAIIGACELSFEAHVRGPGSTGAEATQGASIYKWLASPTCPGGSGVIRNAAFKLTTSGNVLTMEFPFSALPYSSTQISIGPDVVIKPPHGWPAVSQLWANWFCCFSGTTGIIDETYPLQQRFRIGQDVPADIVCTTDELGNRTCSSA